jgi:putative intracellular protease/amidase
MSSLLPNSRALLVVTTVDRMGADGPATGLWLSEFAGPFFDLRDAGFTVEVASPRGGNAPVDPRSKPGMLSSEEPAVSRFKADEHARNWLFNTLPVASVNPDDYAVVVLCGGHGTLWDFPHSEPLTDLLLSTNARGAVIGAICHGPAAFCNERAGEIVRGKTMTCFSNHEERLLGFDDNIPFFMETRLIEQGAVVEPGKPGGNTTIIDGNLVTAQGPGAVEKFGRLLLDALRERGGGQAGLSAGAAF